MIVFGNRLRKFVNSSGSGSIIACSRSLGFPLSIILLTTSCLLSPSRLVPVINTLISLRNPTAEVAKTLSVQDPTSTLFNPAGKSCVLSTDSNGSSNRLRIPSTRLKTRFSVSADTSISPPDLIVTCVSVGYVVA